MKIQKIGRNFLFVLMIIITSNYTFAESSGVIIESDGSTATLNRGRYDNVQVGDQWTIYQNNQPAGNITIQSVGEYSAEGIINSGAPQTGDLVRASKGGFSSPAFDDSETTIVHSPAKPVEFHRPISSSAKDHKLVLRDYEKTLKAHSKSKTFKTPNPAQLQQNLAMAANLYNTYQFTQLTNDALGPMTGVGYSSNPTFWIYGVTGALSNWLTRSQAAKRSQIKVTADVIWWSEDLVNDYADYIASRDSSTMQEALEIKSAAYAQKQIDDYCVFQITLENHSSMRSADFSQFPHQVFVLDDYGHPVVAVSVDPALQKTLTPGQHVTGYVYFPKWVEHQEHLELLFENIDGDRGSIKFH